MRSAWFHRLWLPFLLAAWGAWWIAPIGLGQIPIIINGTAEPAPVKLVRNRTLEAPIEPAAEWRPGFLEILPAEAPMPATPRPQRAHPKEPAPAFEIQVVRPTEFIEPAPHPLPARVKELAPAFEVQVVRPTELIEPPPRPLPAQAKEPAPAFDIQVVRPTNLIEKRAQQLPALPAESAPAFEIEVVLWQPPIEPVIFGSVIGVGPAQVPTWIGSGKDANTTASSMSSIGPVVSFCRPIAGMPDDPPSDGIQMYLMQRTIRRRGVALRSAPDDGIHLRLMQRALSDLPVEEREIQEPVAPRQAVVPQVWPGYSYPEPVPCRHCASQPTAAPQPRDAPLGSRVYAWMIWPLRTLTQPFRDFWE